MLCGNCKFVERLLYQLFFFLASSLTVELRGIMYFMCHTGFGEGVDAVWRSDKTIESHIRECLTINCGCNAYRIRVTVFTICKLA